MSAHRFGNALKPHYNDVVQYCRALCAGRSPLEAEDVLQQALLKAFEHYDDLRDSDRFRSWLFRIITHTFYSVVRRSFWKRFVPLSSVPDVEQMPTVYHRPERFDDRQLLLDALAKLPAKQRAALLLYELGGFSVEEIAAIQQDGSVSAVKSRLSRGRKKLKTIIQRAEHNAGLRAFSTHHTSSPADLDHETLKMVAQAKRAGL